MNDKCVVVTVEELAQHPQADNLDIIRFTHDDIKRQMVVGKHYKVGERGVYIPPGMLLDPEVQEEMWLTGKLNGPARNRVVAKNFKGIFSEGLFYGSSYGKRWKSDWTDGQTVTEEMGCVYAPPK